MAHVALVPAGLPARVRRVLLAAGWSACVGLDASKRQFVTAVRRAARLREEEIAERAPARVEDLETVTALASLSGRELEVLTLICRGWNNVEIAERCYLTINTVKSYIRTAYRKIGVERRAEAVRWGITAGLLTAPADPDEPLAA